MRYEDCIWHKWFAWHPVIVRGRFVWLTHVERKYEPYEMEWLFRPLALPAYAAGEDEGASVPSAWVPTCCKECAADSLTGSFVCSNVNCDCHKANVIRNVPNADPDHPLVDIISDPERSNN